MSAALEQKAIFGYLAAVWNITAHGQMIYQNMPNPSTGPGTFFTSVAIVPNEAARNRNSIGAPKMIRSYGFISFSVFAPENKGSLKQKETIDYILSLFDDKVIPLGNGRNVICQIGSYQTLGLRDALYRMNVTIPFYRDEWPD